MGEKNSLLEAALSYAEQGYPVFPCKPGSKKPWTKHGFKDATTDPEKIEKFWKKNPAANIAIPTEGLIVVDIDTIDGMENPWLDGDPDKQLDLSNGEVQKTPRGGMHYVFRQPEGKQWGSTVSKMANKVDTRGNGGYICVAPSVFEGKHYKWAEGMGLDNNNRENLAEPAPWLVKRLDALAKSDSAAKKTTKAKEGNAIPSGQRNDTLASLAGSMRRVGMSESEILSAITTANEERCNPPLKKGEVEKIAWSIGRYKPDQISIAVTENHYGQIFDEKVDVIEEDVHEEIIDPGPIPSRLLSIPGMINEVKDYTLQTAPHPDETLAFLSALSLQGVLTGRKIRDLAGNRSNLYVLALANSGAGKNHPRIIAQNILYEVGMANCLSDSFSSGEGIEDRLFATPNVLFQTDEIDKITSAISSGRDPRYEMMMQILLKMCTSSGSIYAMRVKAGKDAGVINQPSLSIFGTAVASEFYLSLCEKLMTNGFLARFIIGEAGKRGKGQESELTAIPPRVLEAAKFWADYNPGGGNLGQQNPTPKIIEATPEAKEILISFREHAENEYSKAESRGDNGTMAQWARANEMARRCSLDYASGQSYKKPEITGNAALWATEFMDHQTRKTLYMASKYISNSDFDAMCKLLIKYMEDCRKKHGNKWVTYHAITRKLRWKPREHMEVREALLNQGLIVIDSISTKGRSKIVYRLV